MLLIPSNSWEGQLVAKVERYLREGFGLTVSVEPTSFGSLPYFVADSYALWRVELLGRPSLLMAPRPDTNLTVEEMNRHVDLVRTETATTPVILVFDALSTGRRLGLLGRRIAFMVPLVQLFVPEALLDLRERAPRPKRHQVERFSPTAQVVILGALLTRGSEGANATMLARRYGVAVMSMTRAFDELQAAGLASAKRSGKSRMLTFHKFGRELWNASAPRLQSPVRKVRVVAVPHPDDFPAQLAGESALSQLTDLSRPRTQRLAVAASAWTQLVRDHGLQELEAGEPGADEIETWAYDPAALKRGTIVDRLSLHLSTREHPDERVAQAAEQLLDGMEW